MASEHTFLPSHVFLTVQGQLSFRLWNHEACSFQLHLLKLSIFNEAAKYPRYTAGKEEKEEEKEKRNSSKI